MNTQTDILLVDDDPDVRGSLRETLKRAGYRVEEAVDGVEALDGLDAIRPRLMICDLVMPQRDGLSLIREIRAREIPVAILAISGGTRRGDGPDLVDALDAGADAILPKPFGARDLLRVVKGVLESGKQPSTKV